jgi:hypothetical protein
MPGPATVASLERAGIPPERIRRAQGASARAVRRRGARILRSFGLEPPPEVEALAGALAPALPEVSGHRAGRAGTNLLMEAIATRDAAVCGRAAELLAGLGPGLTPAGDDLLAGAAAAVVAFGDVTGFGGLRRATWLAAATHVHVTARTTPLAARLLLLAAAGEVIRPVEPLLDLTPTGAGRLTGALATLPRLGHSTGRAYGLAVGAGAWLLGRTANESAIQQTGGTRC